MYYCKYCGTANITKTSVCTNCFFEAEAVLIIEDECAAAVYCTDSYAHLKPDLDHLNVKIVANCGHWSCFACFKKCCFSFRCNKCSTDTDRIDFCCAEKVGLDLNPKLRADLAKLYVQIKSFEVSNETYSKYHRHKQLLILLGEYCKWLTIASDGLVPSDAVDDVWQQHILDTGGYQQTCKSIRGKLIDRSISVRDKHSAFVRTLKAYESKFGPVTSATEFYWRISGYYTKIYDAMPNTIQIFVKVLNGATKTFEAHPSMTIETFKHLIREKEGVSVRNQILVWTGKQLEDHKTFNDYYVPKESTFNLVLRLCGC